MRSGWESKKLEDVCLFLNGLWKGETEPFLQVGVIRNTNFTKDGSLDFSDIAYLDVEVKKFSKRQLEYGDIILEKSGGGPKQPVGRVALFDKHEDNFSFSNFTSAIRVVNKYELNFKFLHKFLYWIYVSGVTEKIQSNSTGIRNLDGNAYKSINIQFPNNAEQQRIVAILDQAFEGIAKARANAEQNLQNARALFESHLQSAFTQRGQGWVEKTLKEISVEFGRGKSKHRPRNDPALYKDGKYPFIQTGDIRNCNHIITSYSQTYNDVGLAQSKLWPKGTYMDSSSFANIPCFGFLVRLLTYIRSLNAAFHLKCTTLMGYSRTCSLLLRRAIMPLPFSGFACAGSTCWPSCGLFCNPNIERLSSNFTPLS